MPIGSKASQNRLRTLIRRQRNFKKRKMLADVARLESLLSRWNERVLQINPWLTPRKSLIEVYEERTKFEHKRSDIILWLFSKHSSHGASLLVAKCFVKRISKLSGIRLRTPSNNYEARREVSQGKGKLDLVIKEPKHWIIGIEHKLSDGKENTMEIDGEKEKQTKYQMDGLKANLGVETILGVYLSPSGDAPVDDRWIPFSYYNFVEVIDDAIRRANVKSVGLLGTVRQYFFNAWVKEN